jgi:hypothetical protein
MQSLLAAADFLCNLAQALPAVLLKLIQDFSVSLVEFWREWEDNLVAHTQHKTYDQLDLKSCAFVQKLNNYFYILLININKNK